MAKHERTPESGNLRAWLMAGDSEISLTKAIIAGAALIALVIVACAVLSFCHVQGAW